MTSTKSKYRDLLGKLAAGAALAVVLTMAAANTAQADDRAWRAHEVQARRFHRVHHVYSPEVYAPPVIVTPPPVYAPQPVYAAPAAPSLNFVIPLHIH